MQSKVPSELPTKRQLLLQIVAYAAFALLIGYLSASPTYRHADPDLSVINLVVSHATARIGDCRQLTQDELAELAKNMRKAESCPRERHDLVIELQLDDEVLYFGAERPTGLWRDGPSNIYRKFAVPPGKHRLVMRLRDTGRASGFDYEQTEDIELRPRQNYVVDLRSSP